MSKVIKSKQSGLAPIIVTVYDRLEHLQRCIDSLLANKEASQSTLYIFSDAAARSEDQHRIDAVRTYISGIKGFARVIPILRESNMGAHASTFDAFNSVLRANETFIFLEDDVIVSRHFLRFMNEGLSKYWNDQRILAMCSYSLPFRKPFWYHKSVYLGRRFSPWGFGMWRHKWIEIDFSRWNRSEYVDCDPLLTEKMLSVGADFIGLLKADSKGEIDAIDVRICYHQITNDLYCVFPTYSLSRNSGFDGTGIHCSVTNRFDVILDDRPEFSYVLDDNLRENKTILRRFRKFENGSDGLVCDFVSSMKERISRLVTL